MSGSKSLSLAVSVEGKIIKSNFGDFKAHALEQIESLNFDLQTDEEFGQAEIDVKSLSEFEKQLSQADEDLLKQMEDVYALTSGIAELKKTSSTKRLELSKKIKTQKEVVRATIKREAYGSLPLAHPQGESRIEAAMKGKRTLDSLRAAAEGEAAKITTEIEEAKEAIEAAKAAHGEAVAHGEIALLCSPLEVVRIELERRIERKLAQEEAARIKAEQEAKDKAEADKAKAEAAEKARAEAEEAAKDQPAVELKTEPVAPWAGHPDTLPKPPKIGSIPVGGSVAQAETTEAEAAEFRAFVEDFAREMRPRRHALKDEVNFREAAVFAAAMGAAWSAFLANTNQK